MNTNTDTNTDMGLVWFAELIQVEADKFETLEEWKGLSSSSFNAASNHGGIEKYSNHMTK